MVTGGHRDGEIPGTDRRQRGGGKEGRRDGGVLDNQHSLKTPLSFYRLPSSGRFVLFSFLFSSPFLGLFVVVGREDKVHPGTMSRRPGLGRGVFWWSDMWTTLQTTETSH